MTKIKHNHNQMKTNGIWAKLKLYLLTGLLSMVLMSANSQPVFASAQANLIKPVFTTMAVTNPDSCRVGSALGWLICPFMELLATLADGSYSLFAGFLVLDQSALNYTPDGASQSPAKIAWSTMRDIANIIFAIAVIIVVFSYTTGFGLSRYSIGKIFPKMVASIVLVNFSYSLVQIAIDLSNIVGSSLYSLFDTVTVSIVDRTMPRLGTIGNIFEASLSTVSMFSVIILSILAAKTKVIALVAFAFPVLISAVLALVMSILILFARGAIAIILAVTAPIAFASMVLPNTESFYKVWKKGLLATVTIFPVIALLYGASSMAGKILAMAAAGKTDNATTLLLAAALEVVPLIMAPSLIKSTMAGVPLVGSKLSSLASSLQASGRKKAEGSQIVKSSKDKADIERARRNLGQRYESKLKNPTLKKWDDRFNIGRNKLAEATGKLNDSRFGQTKIGTAFKNANEDKIYSAADSMAGNLTYADANYISQQIASGGEIDLNQIQNARTKQQYLDSGKDRNIASSAAMMAKAKVGKLNETDMASQFTQLKSNGAGTNYLNRVADKIGEDSSKKGRLDVASAVYNKRTLGGSMFDSAGNYQTQTSDELKNYLKSQSSTQLAGMSMDMLDLDSNKTAIKDLYNTDPSFNSSINNALSSNDISAGSAYGISEAIR